MYTVYTTYVNIWDGEISEKPVFHGTYPMFFRFRGSTGRQDSPFLFLSLLGAVSSEENPRSWRITKKIDVKYSLNTTCRNAII